MNTWIFQGNPDKFDIDDYLSRVNEIYWSVTIPKHQKMVSIGDEVYIWRAKGLKTKAISGIIAYGTINEECAPREEVKKPLNLYDSHWKEDWSEASEIKAGVAIKEIRLRPIDGMILVDVLKNDPYVNEMQILKVHVGSNFLLNELQSKTIEKYWVGLNLGDAEIDDNLDFSSAEGKVKFRIHKVRERDPRLRKIAVENYLLTHDKLICEVCGFSFENVYGELGKGFIEVHHLKPISHYSDGELTVLENLKLVCSNCHRMIHRGDPLSTYISLQERLT